MFGCFVVVSGSLFAKRISNSQHLSFHWTSGRSMYIIMFHAFPFHTLEDERLEATASTHERKGSSDLPTKPPSILVQPLIFPFYGCINLHWCIECPELDSRTVGSWPHPTQAGTKTLFKAVKAFEKRESCDEAESCRG